MNTIIHTPQNANISENIRQNVDLGQVSNSSDGTFHNLPTKNLIEALTFFAGDTLAIKYLCRILWFHDNHGIFKESTQTTAEFFNCSYGTIANIKTKFKNAGLIVCEKASEWDKSVKQYIHIQWEAINKEFKSALDRWRIFFEKKKLKACEKEMKGKLRTSEKVMKDSDVGCALNKNNNNRKNNKDKDKPNLGFGNFNSLFKGLVDKAKNPTNLPQIPGIVEATSFEWKYFKDEQLIRWLDYLNKEHGFVIRTTHAQKYGAQLNELIKEGHDANRILDYCIGGNYRALFKVDDNSRAAKPVVDTMDDETKKLKARYKKLCYDSRFPDAYSNDSYQRMLAEIGRLKEKLKGAIYD